MHKKSQLEMNLNTHGGRRAGAGRKPVKGSLGSHAPRAKVTKHTPVHITIKLRPGLMDLRSQKVMSVFIHAAKLASQFDLKFIHFSLQYNHLHLIAESRNNKALSQGMQSFTIAFGKGINRLMKRNGSVFRSRYHLHVLKSPPEVKYALRYVLCNASKHLKRKIHFDVFSSASLFFAWWELGVRLRPPEPNWDLSPVLARPSSWLLAEGWLRATG